MPNPNNPRLLLILDLQGEPAEPRHLEYMKARLCQMLGSDRMHPHFWITRNDLAQEFRAAHGFMNQPALGEEPRHEPTFDFYVDGGIVPPGRIVNAKIPDWSDHAPGL